MPKIHEFYWREDRLFWGMRFVGEVIRYGVDTDQAADQDKFTARINLHGVWKHDVLPNAPLPKEQAKQELEKAVCHWFAGTKYSSQQILSRHTEDDR